MHKAPDVYCYVQRRSAEDVTVRELPPEFRPPEWLTDVVTRTTPYFPQMGDEVIYFVQGHRQYVDTVQTNNVYRIDVDRNQPWHKMPHIRVCSFCLSSVSDNNWQLGDPEGNIRLVECKDSASWVKSDDGE